MKLLRRLHFYFMILLCTVLVLKAFLRYQGHFDFLTFHLPAALTYFNLTKYIMLPQVIEAFHGYPPVANWIQGFLIYLTGRVSVACGIGVIGLLIAFYFVRRAENPSFSWRWFLTALLAMPLFVVHLNTGYIDLWVGATLFLAFVGLFHFLIDPNSSLFAGMILLGSALSFNSKYLAWPFVALVLSVMGGFAIRTYIQKQIPMTRFLCLFILSLMVILPLPAKNWFLYQNPIHPLHHRFLPEGAKSFSKTMEQDVFRENVPPYLIEASRPRIFFESVFELNRFRASPEFAPYGYEPGMGAQARSPHTRMGGWSGINMLILTIGLILSWIFAPHLRKNLFVLGVALVLLAVVPQNHELRYWFFFPITGFYILTRALSSIPKSIQLGLKIAMIIALAFSLLSLPEFYRISLRRSEDLAPAEARAYWEGRETRGVHPDEIECVENQVPNTIYWAGPKFNSYAVQDCPR